MFPWEGANQPIKAPVAEAMRSCKNDLLDSLRCRGRARDERVTWQGDLSIGRGLRNTNPKPHPQHPTSRGILLSLACPSVVMDVVAVPEAENS